MQNLYRQLFLLDNQSHLTRHVNFAPVILEQNNLTNFESTSTINKIYL